MFASFIVYHFSSAGGAGQGVRVDCDCDAADVVRMGAGGDCGDCDVQLIFFGREYVLNFSYKKQEFAIIYLSFSLYFVHYEIRLFFR